MTQRTAHFPLQGGLNLVTPAIRTPPGHVIAGVNYEPVERGYRRIEGYERYDGQPKPSEASYWVLNFDAGSAPTIKEGAAVTGATSAATGKALVDAVVTGGTAALDAVLFDGTNDYLLRGGGLTGAADSSTGILVVWLEKTADGVGGEVFRGGSGAEVRLAHLSDNTILLSLSSSGSSNLLLAFNTSAVLVADGLCCLMFSWNTNFSAGNKIVHAYKRDTSLAPTLNDADAAFNVDYTLDDWAVGATLTGATKHAGGMRQVYFAPGQFLDFSVEANRRKFVDANGQPVALGADGSTPTGVAPLILLSGAAASFHVNLGTGGSFSTTGALADYSTYAPGAVLSGYLVLSAVSGTFQNNENLQVSAVTRAVADGTATERGASNDTDDTTWYRDAIETARALIQTVTGSGRIRGLWWYNSTVYAFRDNAGGTAGAMWKATTSGWTAVDLGRSLSFTSGGTTEIAEGDTITGETSAATGVVGRVILTSGTWAGGDAAGRFILTSQTGTFQAETVKVGASLNLATIAGNSTATTLPAGGRYEFVNHNFFGQEDLRRMYGVNGVGTGFEFDGTVFVPILTGMPTDTPTHVGVYKNHLFYSFPGGSIQNSGTGEPYEWTAISGAAEIGLGETVRGFGQDVSRGLAILSRSKIAILYGNDVTDFILDVVTEDSGAIEWTVQKLGQLMYMDDRGIRDMRTTALYGNFKIGTITQMVEPLLKAKKAAGVEPINSMRVRAKDQYRLFFDDGTGIAIYLGRKDPEILPFDLDLVVYAVASCECQTLGEVMFFGSDDGYVYELDAGTSFDGAAITAFLRLPFNHVGSSTQNKRWQKATLEVDAAPTTQLGLTAEFSYADPDQPPSVEQSFSVAGGGGFWDEDNFDAFYWSSPVEGLAECHKDGLGRNFSLAVLSSATYEEPHTVHGLTLHFSYRGLQR